MSARLALLGLLGTALAACGDDEARPVVVAPEAGAPEPDAGRPPRARVNSPELRMLLAGGNYRVIGVTTNYEPHAVYYQFNLDDTIDVAAVPVYGGAPILLQKAIAKEDEAFVSGGAVAWYTGTNGAGTAAALSIWTPENGTKQLTTKTVAGLFAATADGSRVAFSAGADLDESPLVVTSSAAPVIDAPALGGETALNLAAIAPQCAPSIEFHGTTLFGAFCTGFAPDETGARLFTVDAAGLAVERANAQGLGTGDLLFFDVDAVARRAFVFTGDFHGHLVTLDGASTTVKDLGLVNDAQLLSDGSGVIVLREDGLLRIAEEDLVLAPNATILYGVTRDSRAVLIGTTEPQAPATDLVSIPSVGGPAATLVSTPTARFIDVSGTSSHVIVRTDVVDGAGPLQAIPVNGGAAVTLAPTSFGANVAIEGTGVLAVTDASSVINAQAFRATFAYVDAVAAAPPLEITTALLTSDTGRWVDRSFVYQDQGNEPALYALELP